MSKTLSGQFCIRSISALLLWCCLAYSSAFAGGLPSQGSVSIGVVFTADLPRYQRAYDAFVSGLAADPALFSRLKIYRQIPNPDPFSWENSIRRAVASGCDLLVTFGAPATLAARKVAPDKPLIYGDVYGPKRLNSSETSRLLTEKTTGVSSHVPMATLVRSFANLLRPKKMGALFNSLEQGSSLQVKELKDLVNSLGISLHLRDVQTKQQLEKALAEFDALNIEGVYLSESSVVGSQADILFDWSRRHRLPVISHVPGAGAQGALLSHEVSPEEQGRLMARCLEVGLDPGRQDCPNVVAPKEIDFWVNVQLARDYGLRVPFQTLTLATKVIH